MQDLVHTIFDLNQTSYWYPLIWVLIGGILFDCFPKVTLLVNGRYHRRWYWISAFFVVLPLILWSGFRHSFVDTYAYINSFNTTSSNLADIPALITEDSKDVGFYSLIIVLKAMGVKTYTVFFMILAIIQMFCIVYFFRKYSPNFWISIFLFVASTDYLSWMHNTIRQFTAVCILLVAFDLLVERRYCLFSIIVLLCSTIHGSALMMFPLAYVMRGTALNRKTLLVIAATVVLIPFLDQLMPFLSDMLSDTQYSDVTSNDIWVNDDGTNPVRVLVYSVPALVAFCGWKYIRTSDDPAMNMCVNASVITMALYLISAFTSGIYIGRLPIYTTLHGYVALPWMFKQIFEKNSISLMNVLMLTFYVLFYYYQISITWGLT